MSTIMELYTYKARISEKGDSGFYRMTIPADMRKLLHVGVGDMVRIGIKDDKIMIIKSNNGLGMKISKDGNIQLPVRLSERYKVKTGDEALFYQENGRIYINITNT